MAGNAAVFFSLDMYVEKFVSCNAYEMKYWTRIM